MTGDSRRRSLAARWLTFQFAGLLLVLGGLGVYAYLLFENNVRTDVEVAGANVIATVTRFVGRREDAMVGDGLQGIVLRIVGRTPSIERVSIVDRERRIVADSDLTPAGTFVNEPSLGDALAGERVSPVVTTRQGRRFVRLVEPIEGSYDPGVRSAIRGAVMVDVDLSRSEARMRKVLVRLTLMVAFAIGILWVFQILALRHLLLRRLSAIRLAVVRFGDGDTGVRATVGPPDEIGAVEASFNEMANDVEQAAKERAAAERMKTDFVSFASHQLRTPLSGLNWMLELAAATPGLPESARSYLADARTSSNRLVHMVNELLAVSRLEGGRVEIRLEPVDLAQMTRDVLAELASEIAARGHDVRLDLRPPIPRVMADALLLREAVINLASNAVKFTRPGGRVTVSLLPEDGLVRWAVADSGIGVPRAQQAQIFEKFFRADNAMAVEIEGTGLGLSFVRLVLERFGGRVWCESEEGQGATFTFTLPAEKSVG